MMAIFRLVETPQAKKKHMVQNRPVMMIGFLPNLSEARPQGTAVKLCAKEKTALVAPAHLATSFSSTPKLAIISGKYGYTEVMANGSANRATAEGIC